MQTARPTSFSLAEARGYNLFTNFILIALLFEGVPMHLLLHRWSPTAAWISTAATIYGVVWILRLKRSLALQPILIDAQSVVLQIGLLWRVEFPRDRIAACRRITSANAPARDEAGYLQLVVLNEPQWLVELSEPVIAHGPFGRKKAVTRIGVAVDDAQGFGEALHVT
jgi:hypothetical protein